MTPVPFKGEIRTRRARIDETNTKNNSKGRGRGRARRLAISAVVEECKDLLDRLALKEVFFFPFSACFVLQNLCSISSIYMSATISDLKCEYVTLLYST